MAISRNRPSVRACPERSIAAIREAREQAGRMSQDVAALTAQARSADTIVTSVDELADRVNLLAVNAAIEAARAGDHGLGFAVVAREIRGLADEAKRSTRQVRAILDEIGASTGRAVSLGAEVEQAVDAASSVVQETGGVIVQLEEAIRAARLAADRISDATQQQAGSLQQVSDAVRDISRAAVESSGQVAVISDAAESVRTHGRDIEALRAAGA